ncbi:MAG: tetratricopeptide repeat protein [Verrucomicrobiota bacterium]
MPLIIGIGLLFFALSPALAQQENTAEVTLTGLRPSEEDLFQQAVEQQRWAKYALAIQLFTDLLRFYPEGKNTEEAIYCVAESYRALGRFDDAFAALKLMREKFPQGVWTEPSWLLEGEILAADQKWEASMQALKKVLPSSKAALQVRALYLMILAKDNLGTLSSARPELEKLSSMAKDNPFLDFAKMKMGVLEAEAGHADAALALFKETLGHTNDALLRAEAAVRAGNLSYAQNQYKKALGFYEVVRHIDAPDFWKELTHLGLLQTNFSLGDYEAVVKIFNEVRPQFPPKARAQVFFLAAESYRLLKKNKEALETYEFLLKEFPESETAEPSAWARLLLLEKDPRLLDATAAFIAKYPQSERLPYAQLMRADAFFAKEQYATCAPMYALAAEHSAIQKLDPLIYSMMLFRWGYSAYFSKNFTKAAEILKKFLEQKAQHLLTTTALWLLSQSLQATQENAEAQNVLEKLLRKEEAFPQREQALWQSSMLAIHTKDFALAQTRLESLLKQYPETAHVAEAHYWLAHALCQQKCDADSVAHWQKARVLKPDVYSESSSQQLIRVFLESKDLTNLTEEVRRYDDWRARHANASPVALDVIEWIAQNLAQTLHPSQAETYFRRVLAESEDTSQRQRAQLGLAMLLSKVQNWGGAIREWKIYRVNFPTEANRSAILEYLAQAYIGAAEFNEAQTLAEQILQQNPEGEFNARARMLLGEIAFAKHNYDEAAKIFSAVALLIQHPEITPRAQQRAADAQKAGKR